MREARLLVRGSRAGHCGAGAEGGKRRGEHSGTDQPGRPAVAGRAAAGLEAAADVLRAVLRVDLFGDGALPFVYPFELDAHTRLKGGDKASQYDPALDFERRQRFIQEARAASN